MLLFLVCAIVGLDTLGQVSGYGAQTFTWVIILAVLFLFPYALVVAAPMAGLAERPGVVAVVSAGNIDPAKLAAILTGVPS